MRTSLYLNREDKKEFEAIRELVGECPAVVLRLAVREGLKTLRKKYEPKPDLKNLSGQTGT